MVRCGKLAKMVGITRKHVHDLARSGRIPGAKRTKGGHYYFMDCPALKDWIHNRKIAVDVRKFRRTRTRCCTAEDLGDRKIFKTLDLLQEWLITRPRGFWDDPMNRKDLKE